MRTIRIQDWESRVDRNDPDFSEHAVKVYLPHSHFIVLDRGYIYTLDNNDGVWKRTHPDMAKS